MDKASLIESKDKIRLKPETNVRSPTLTSNKKAKEPFQNSRPNKKAEEHKMRQKPPSVRNYNQYNVINKSYSIFGGPRNSYGPNPDLEKKDCAIKRCGKSCLRCARGMCCLF